ncbi:hypothetical protein NEOLI_004049 [Neolecta irregularis DAH-3]|uniref:Uncharacterized protein n=1 Tax=Neolecta irregularis (strain DAH-3) TaxID=1198029 RepID=A0A1U7LM30_NEOID|nr:hypothetical protein NEOLI_004049 [Neolecta irregularis DAH-3]|eukprot:OLL23571.1 hypothetical protein NEOLI_004049 [Neolecta irregularis DAH-3]
MPFRLPFAASAAPKCQTHRFVHFNLHSRPHIPANFQSHFAAQQRLRKIHSFHAATKRSRELSVLGNRGITLQPLKLINPRKYLQKPLHSLDRKNISRRNSFKSPPDSETFMRRRNSTGHERDSLELQRFREARADLFLKTCQREREQRINIRRRLSLPK